MATVCWSLWYSYSVMATICWPQSGGQCAMEVVWWPLKAGYCVMATVSWQCAMTTEWWPLFDSPSVVVTVWRPMSGEHCDGHHVVVTMWWLLCDGHHTIATVWGSLLFGGACVMAIVRCPPCNRAWANALCQNTCLVHKKSQVQFPAPLYHPDDTQRCLFTLSCQNRPLPHYE